MKNYVCNKCGSIDVFIDDRGNQKALMCGDCGAWIKWIGKQEIALVKRFIESNNTNILYNSKYNIKITNCINGNTKEFITDNAKASKIIAILEGDK